MGTTLYSFTPSYQPGRQAYAGTFVPVEHHPHTVTALLWYGNQREAAEANDDLYRANLSKLRDLKPREASFDRFYELLRTVPYSGVPNPIQVWREPAGLFISDGSHRASILVALGWQDRLRYEVQSKDPGRWSVRVTGT